MFLAIDTATQVCSAALVREGEVLAECTEIAPQRHAELLLPFVENVFRTGATEPATCDGIAVSIGPGSFTGLRIGLSVAKGIAFGIQKLIIPVPTVEGVAYNTVRKTGERSVVQVILPARKDEYYTARVDCAGERPVPEENVSVVTTTELYDLVCGKKDGTLAGEGIERFYRDLTKERGENDPVCIRLRNSLGSYLHTTSAVAVGLLAPMYEAADPAYLEPVYVKQFESGSLTKKM
jgi:tRNA threonylcarbamoyladenosine biosynthesis protein TsaB